MQAKFRGQLLYFIIHIEDQSTAESEFGRRMFNYFARIHEKYALPIYPILICSYDQPKRPEPDSYKIKFPDREVLSFNYAVIQLNRLNWRDFLQQENPVAAALMAKMKIKPQDRPKVKAECLRLLATLRLDPAKMQLISGFVDSYLRLNQQEETIFQAELNKMGLVEQEAVMQIVTSWMEQGIEQGLQQGEIVLILRLLTRRFGPLTPAIETQIRNLSLEQLDNLADALLDFQTETELQEWLAQN